MSAVQELYRGGPCDHHQCKGKNWKETGLDRGRSGAVLQLKTLADYKGSPEVGMAFRTVLGGGELTGPSYVHHDQAVDAGSPGKGA